MTCRYVSMMAVLILALPGVAAAQDQKPDKSAAKTKAGAPPDKDAEKPAIPPKQKLTSAGKVSGVLVQFDASERTLVVDVPVLDKATVDADLAAQQLNRNIYDKNVQIARIRARVAQQDPHYYKPQKTEIQATDDAKIRLAQPPAEYDQKGNPKRYTPTELRALKGAGNLWGYAGDFDSLKVGQHVVVEVLKSRDSGKKNAYKSGAQGKAEDKSSATPSEPKLYTSMVRIMKDTDK